MPLFLFTFVLSQLIASPLSAQDLKNRTAEIFHLGTVIISSESLPDKVYEAQKDKIFVSVIFIDKNTGDVFINSVGTGFITETPGIVFTARHLFDMPLVQAEEIKNRKKEAGLNFDFDYMFMGTIITEKEWANFPLYLVATGEKGTAKDVMVLKTDAKTMEKAKMVDDAFNHNPLRMLMRTSKFADAKIGEKVYISGYAPSIGEYLDKNNRIVPVYADLIDQTFSAEIQERITNMAINKAGVKMLYRLRDSAEPGFSGGKVMNDQGQVIGMTISASASKNFIYAISSQDIQDFLKENKLK